MKNLVINPELTNMCNYRCKFCPHSYYKKDTPGGNKFDRPKGSMSLELWKIVLKNARRYGKSLCLGFFGEPLLHKRFAEFVNLVPKKRGYTLELNTNFSMVTDHTMPLLKKFDIVKISLDTTKSKQYDQLCPSKFVLDMRGKKIEKDRLKTIEDKVFRWLHTSRNTRTRLVYVISSYNVQGVKAFVKKWSGQLSRKDHILTKSVLSYGGVVTDAYMQKNKCKVLGQRWRIIGWNGDCSPCNLDINLSLNMGNLLKNRDLGGMLIPCKVHKVIENKQGICANCFDANNWKKNKTYKSPVYQGKY